MIYLVDDLAHDSDFSYQAQTLSFCNRTVRTVWAWEEMKHVCTSCDYGDFLVSSFVVCKYLCEEVHGLKRHGNI